MTKRIAALIGIASFLAACAVPTAVEQKGTTGSKLEGERWQPPQSDATGTYVGVNGEGCSGGLKPGTQQLGEQLKAQFNTTYGGYSCRQNTANASELSIHAVGRALDVTAQDQLGDQIANYLVENATTIGIQLIIWNHTIWEVRESGATSRQYTGPNPHTDHVHAEVTMETAANGPGNAGGAGTQTPSDGLGGTQTPGTDGWGTATPSQGSSGGTGSGNDDSQQYPDMGWGEYECAKNTDCDPSGQIACNSGYCSQ